MIIAGIAGLVIFLKTKWTILHPMVVPLVSVLLIVTPVASGWVELGNLDEGQSINPVENEQIALPGYDGFDLQPSLVRSTSTYDAGDVGGEDDIITYYSGDYNFLTNLNDDNKKINIPIIIDTEDSAYTLHSDYEEISFTIAPIPEQNTNMETLATLYYESDYNVEVGGKNIFSETDGKKDVVWEEEDGNTDYYSGHVSLNMTSDTEISVNYSFDSGSDSWCEEVDSDDSYTTLVSWEIRLYNDHGWSETYTVNLIPLYALFYDGFEDSDDYDSGWTGNTGWSDTLYWFPHSGSQHAYSWAENDNISINNKTLDGTNTLYFWYAVEYYEGEVANSPDGMDYNIWVGDTLVLDSDNNTNSEYKVLGKGYELVSVDLSSYSGSYNITFEGMTAALYGQCIDDVYII